MDGKLTKPAFDVSDGWSLAIDTTGKIYVTQPDIQAVSSYAANGTPTSPTTIYTGEGPVSVTGDSNGKIYVVDFEPFVSDYLAGTVTTYLANGKQTLPTISNLNHPSGVAVGTDGRIYVVNSSSMTTYTAEGRPTI